VGGKSFEIICKILNIWCFRYFNFQRRGRLWKYLSQNKYWAIMELLKWTIAPAINEVRMKKLLAVFVFGLISTSAFAWTVNSIPSGYHCECHFVNSIYDGASTYSCGPWIKSNVRGLSASNTARVSGVQPTALGNGSIKNIPAIYKPQFDAAKPSAGGPVRP
jgi:hypothetical protein